MEGEYVSFFCSSECCGCESLFYVPSEKRFAWNFDFVSTCAVMTVSFVSTGVNTGQCSVCFGKKAFGVRKEKEVLLLKYKCSVFFSSPDFPHRSACRRVCHNLPSCLPCRVQQWLQLCWSCQFLPLWLGTSGDTFVFLLKQTNKDTKKRKLSFMQMLM